jgi:hypothetical protein
MAWWRRALARFGFAYWLLFCSSVMTQVFDFEWLAATLGKAWTEAGLLVGYHLLGISEPIATATNGSGDRTIDYLILLAILILSVVIAGIWSRFDTRGRNDAQVRELVRISIRYTLGFLMLSYGIAKLSAEYGQFPPPNARRLLQPYGESSPMGLLWTFMGSSQAYTKLAGLAEVLGGTLLLFRRTTLAGALVLVGVMGNVVALNFCYDVPVKINSTHYLVMAGVLLAPDLRRLIDVIVLHRAVAAPPPPAVLRFRGRRMPVVIAKVTVIGTFLVLLGLGMLERTSTKRIMWFDGYWDVESFTRNGTAVPAVVDDKTRWRRIKLESSSEQSLMRWHFMDGSYGELLVVVEHSDHRLSFKTAGDATPVNTYTFAVTRSDADHFTLTGKVGADELDVKLRRLEVGQMRLVSRGFHWINEAPFNR